MELPDIRQQAEYDCGAAACRIALYVLRRRLTAPMAERLGTNPIDGTDPRAIETTLRHAGLGVLAGEMTWEDLAAQATMGRPVICLVTRNGTGHYVVSGGLSGRAALRIQCPADGPVIAKKGRFLAAWRDVDRLGATYHQFGIAVWRLQPHRRPTG